MPLQNDRSLSNPLQNGLFFLASHASKGLAPDCAGYIFASIYTFSVPPLCPNKVRGPRPTSPIIANHAPTKWEVSFQTPTTGVGIVVLFFCPFSQTYNLYKTLDCSKLFRFLTPIMWFLQKKKHRRHTHTEQQVLNLFQVGFLGPLDLLQNGYLEIDNGFGCFKLLRAPQSQFIVYKLGPI